MKIASFNVNSLRARLPIVLRWLTEHQPNVLCVQETKVQDADFPVDAFSDSGYKYVFKGQKSYNGVAIFSRSQISDVKFGFDDEPKDEARLIRAEIKPVRKLGRGPTRRDARRVCDTSRQAPQRTGRSFLSNGVNGISIVNSYVPQGYLPESEKFEYKLNWFNRLLTFFDKNFKPTDLVLWVGDFNIAPEPIDVYDPEGLSGHVCFHPEVHKKLEKIMQWGFVDVFRMHCKEAGQYTFWDYRLRNSFKRDLGWRLDHIMATQPLAKLCTACCIDKEPRTKDRPSDHTPVVAEFDW